jgi:hypothetical protein
MSLPACVRCQVLETESVLLRAEVAGLKRAVLDLSRPAEAAPGLDIMGVSQPQRLAFFAPERSGSEHFYRVLLTHREQLSATCGILSLDPERFAAFFEELALQSGGWEGVKSVESEEGQLTLSCTNEGAEVWMNVSCALDLPTVDPYWTVQLRLELDPNTLHGLAGRARAFFSGGRS